jgi:hypothetical protein
MEMKCPKCGAENSDYAFFCGKCAADLKSEDWAPSELEAKKKLPTIMSMVGRRLLHVEENLRKRREKRFGGLKAFQRNGSMTFKSEIETVTLTVDKVGHASIRPGEPDGTALLLEGPHEAFVEMFKEQAGVGSIPYSIEVKLMGLSSHQEMVMFSKRKRDRTLELLIREAAEKTLKGFFG